MLNKKRILIMNDFVFAGGVESVMHDFAEYLSCKNYDVTVFTHFREKNFYNGYSRNVKHRYFHWFKVNNVKLARFIYKLMRISQIAMRYKKYDVVIAMKEGSIPKDTFWFKNTKKRIMWVHSDFENLHCSSGLFKNDEEERSIYEKFDYTVCVTKAVEENLIKTIGDPNNTVVKYNPVNIEKIINLSKEQCDLKRPEDKKLFITVGRISHEKGYAELVEGIAKMQERNFEFWIIGGGNSKYCEDEEYYSRVKRVIDENNLSSVVKMLGRKKNPYPYLKQADFYICSSFSESFCVSIQEALALGVPVITTNCPGAVELLNSDVCVVVDKIDDIPQVMQDVIDDKYSFDLSNYRYPPLNEIMDEIEKLL